MPFYFPLIDLHMATNDFIISDHLRIAKKPYDLDKAEKVTGLSEYHRTRLKITPYWAIVDGNGVNSEDASIFINALLLAFQVVGPIKATTFFKFEDYKLATIIHTQFHHNEKDTFVNCGIDELTQTSSIYRQLLRIYKSNKRLQTAMVNSYYACTTYQWKVGYICLSAALEAMLTYKRGLGITKRLAKSYACLTEHKKSQRNKAYRQMIKLYGIRSRIMHGETRGLRNPDRNLQLLSEFSGVLRKLWQTVLSNKDICRELEKGDQKRRLFFKTIEAGYNEPYVKIIP